jgi:hypothetical protein
MSELDDVHLDRPASAPDGGRPPRRRPSGWGWLLVLLLLAVIAAVAWYFLRGRPGTEELAPPVAEEPVAATQPAEQVAPELAEEPLEMPSLDASDELVRRLAACLSSNPVLASWVASDDLVRRFVVVVDNLAVGLLPRKEVPFLAPEGEFRAASAPAGPPRIDPVSYDRYDAAAAVISSLDAGGTVALYRRLRPLVDEAARERLGYGAERFDETLRRAILHLLETPVPSGPPALEPRVRSYHYADPRLEELSDAQKQLLRMGPENQRRVQAKLRQLARRLGVPADRIPSERTLSPIA